MPPTVLRLAAFADGPGGGNPAGVVLDAAGSDDGTMLAMSAAFTSVEPAVGPLEPPALDRLLALLDVPSGRLSTRYPPRAAFASASEFEARNLFPVGTMDEDPATGSAAASVGAYLRHLQLVRPPVEVLIRSGDRASIRTRVAGSS